MVDNCSSNITQIVTSFESFIKILEDSDWARVAKIEDIKSAFKLGSFIEKTMEHFRIQDSSEQFLNVLKKWLKSKNRTKVYSESFFATACDELIIKFFISTNISEQNLDIAVRVYTSIFPKKRFEEVLTRILLNAGNLEALSDYIKSNFNEEETKYFEYNIKLQNWDCLLQTGKLNCVKDEINNMLLPYNVNSFLYLLLGILSLNQEDKLVQNLVLNNVLEQMSLRTILTKEFWTTMFKSINIKIICDICKNFQEFLNSFLNFIVYIGSMMNKVGIHWRSDQNICSYPDIEYEEILNILSKLSKSSEDIEQLIVNRLNEAKQCSSANIWDEMLYEINGK